MKNDKSETDTLNNEKVFEKNKDCDVKKITIDELEKEQIFADVQQIKKELTKLNNHKLIFIYNSIPRILAYSFIKGLLTGFGTVIGATLLVSIFIYLLSKIEFIPIIGDLVNAVIREVQKVK